MGEPRFGMQPREGIMKLWARDDIGVNSKDVHGRTPILYAAERGHKEVVRMMLARDDIDVNLKDVCG